MIPPQHLSLLVADPQMVGEPAPHIARVIRDPPGDPDVSRPALAAAPVRQSLGLAAEQLGQSSVVNKTSPWSLLLIAFTPHFWPVFQRKKMGANPLCTHFRLRLAGSSRGGTDSPPATRANNL